MRTTDATSCSAASPAAAVRSIAELLCIVELAPCTLVGPTLLVDLVLRGPRLASPPCGRA